MILDSPVLNDLTIGADRVVPQEGDSQVLLSSEISAVLLPSLRTIFPNTIGNIATTGLCLHLDDSQAASTGLVNVTLAVLPRGNYAIEIAMASRITGTKVGGAGAGLDGPFVRFSTAVVADVKLIGFFHSAGTFYEERVLNVILPDTTNLIYVAPATGVGEAHDTTVSINIIRRL